MATIEELMQHPAYLDEKHAEHKAVTEQVADLKGSWRSTLDTSAPGSPSKLDELVNHKAYFDPKHPEHVEICKQVQDICKKQAREAGWGPSTTYLTGDFGKLMSHPDKGVRDEAIAVNRLMSSPAYFDAQHPDHLATKTAVRDWIEDATRPAEE